MNEDSQSVFRHLLQHGDRMPDIDVVRALLEHRHATNFRLVAQRFADQIQQVAARLELLFARYPARRGSVDLSPAMITLLKMVAGREDSTALVPLTQTAGDGPDGSGGAPSDWPAADAS